MLPMNATENSVIVMTAMVRLRLREQPEVDQRVLLAQGVEDEADHEGETDERRDQDLRRRRPCRRRGSTRRRRGTARGRARAAACRGSRTTRTAAACRSGSTRSAATNATMPIGRLIRKIQCQLAAWISQPPRIGPPIGPSSIGTPSTAITRPTRSGPAARVMIVMPSGISMPPPRPCSTRKRDQRADVPGHAAQRRPGDEQHDRRQVEALGAEAVGGPAGDRNDRGQRQRVGRHRPGDRRVGGVEDALERGQRDADHGDVEDRHDGAEHDHAGDLQNTTVEFVRRGVRGRSVNVMR